MEHYYFSKVQRFLLHKCLPNVTFLVVKRPSVLLSLFIYLFRCVSLKPSPVVNSSYKMFHTTTGIIVDPLLLFVLNSKEQETIVSVHRDFPLLSTVVRYVT